MAHTCHATACDKHVPPSMWGCRKHWFMVPKAIRDRIWKHYRAGQESDWKPNRSYLNAARDAVLHVAEREGVEPDTRIYDAFLEDADFAPCTCNTDVWREIPTDICEMCGGQVQPTEPAQ